MKLKGFIASLLVIIAFACQTKKAEKISKDEAIVKENVTNVGEIVIKVDGMTCDGCEKSVEAGLSKIAGVAEVKADHETGVTRVKADTININKAILAETIEKIGYKVQ